MENAKTTVCDEKRKFGKKLGNTDLFPFFSSFSIFIQSWKILKFVHIRVNN